MGPIPPFSAPFHRDISIHPSRVGWDGKSIQGTTPETYAKTINFYKNQRTKYSLGNTSLLKSMFFPDFGVRTFFVSNECFHFASSNHDYPFPQISTSVVVPYCNYYIIFQKKAKGRIFYGWTGIDNQGGYLSIPSLVGFPLRPHWLTSKKGGVTETQQRKI